MILMPNIFFVDRVTNFAFTIMTIGVFIICELFRIDRLIFSCFYKFPDRISKDKYENREIPAAVEERYGMHNTTDKSE